ncbi:MAG TPA: penicillin-binding transpeptidase domain-containing protein [Kofleriaceae bacterium]|nr:penicillin-binding transpeptidase domain-containing protein [Kofleriaceae bacterium]
MRALAIFSLSISLVTAACGDKQSAPTPQPQPQPQPASPATDAAPAKPASVDIHGLTDLPACFVVRAPDGTVRQSDEATCQKRLRPASTFKIPNALVGADVGLLDGPDAIMTYDAKTYPKQAYWPEGWDRDQPLRDAMRISAVPLFRRLATQIGPERMQAHLDAFDYGNKDISGGQDTFWLEGGGLRISAPEQVAFLTKLLAGALPVKPEALATVRAALPTEISGDATLHWKTGTSREEPEPWIAWLVGWVERPDGNHIFACWLADPADDVDTVRTRRMAFCKSVLARLGLFVSAPESSR